jgi:tetratricopeptide (TPR) repeat protein
MKSYGKLSSRLACLLAGIMLALSGCASTPVAVVAVHPLEQNALNLLHRQVPANAVGHQQTHAALAAALRQHQRFDDLQGQWRIHQLLAQEALHWHSAAELLPQVEAMAALAEQLPVKLVAYPTAIMRGHIAPHGKHFDDALAYARSPLEQAVALAYLGRLGEAMALLDAAETDSPADRAFVFYQSAQQRQDPAGYKQALVYYRLAADDRGVADCLVRLARLAQAAGQSGDARIYGQRAALVLTAAGDADRAASVEAWLGRL